MIEFFYLLMGELLFYFVICVEVYIIFWVVMSTTQPSSCRRRWASKSRGL